MGILDDLLAGLAGQGMGGRANPQATRAGSGAGMSQVLMALMPIVLGMLANRGSRRFADSNELGTGEWRPR